MRGGFDEGKMKVFFNEVFEAAGGERIEVSIKSYEQGARKIDVSRMSFKGRRYNLGWMDLPSVEALVKLLRNAVKAFEIEEKQDEKSKTKKSKISNHKGVLANVGTKS